jgi:hypothetical protein
MGAALVPELLAVTLRLGREYKLPVLLPRDLGSYLDRLDLGPLIRHFTQAPWPSSRRPAHPLLITSA